MCSSGAIGIDFGGGTVKIAVAKRGGIEIISNEASNRESQVVVGFGPNERFIGEHGFVQLLTNFKNTVIYPNRFLGMKSDALFFNNEKKWLYNTIVINSDNNPLFEVNYKRNLSHFTAEQLTAMILQKIKQNISQNNFSGNEIVLSVPNYYSQQERMALLDAAKIADIKVLRLLNESAAIALAYGFFRLNDFMAGPRHVAFVDFGQCSTSAFVASFTNTCTEITNQISERNLGVRDIDWKILEFYSDICVNQYNTNPIKKDKLRMRMIDAIEKQRKILSANLEAAINLDNITEESDFSYVLTRKKLEELVTPIVLQFKCMLESFKTQLTIPIHSIEIIGGGTRIPIIQQTIQQVFQVDISRTCDASECIARGCAINSAMLSPSFKVAHYNIVEFNYYPIKCSWMFLTNGDMDLENDPKRIDDSQTSILFDSGCKVPNIKSVTFNADKLIQLNVFYDPIPPGANVLLDRLIINPNLKLKVELNKNGIVEFDNAHNMSNDKRITELSLQEHEMNNNDIDAHKTYAKKNELESYLYNIRANIDDKYQGYVQPNLKSKIIEDLNECERWLYDEGLDLTKDIYQQKIDDLKMHVDPIVRRHNEYEIIPNIIENFNKVLSTYESLQSTSTEENKYLFDSITEYKTYIKHITDAFCSTSHFFNPPASSTDIINKHKSLIEILDNIKNKMDIEK